ncbi:hypothetical protein GCM10009006_33520 [Haloarcula argentinensis]|uniref:Uncharacterized protein n=1 Tax=Haloarcula argentinensis TaxID=43776 RepID=A0A830FR50_HALAR|nr:hypothetical protein GCM10009006_33520 [Haloarcula argentinensis]
MIGVPALVLGLVGLTGNVAAGILFLLLSTVTLGVAGQLIRGSFAKRMRPMRIVYRTGSR